MIEGRTLLTVWSAMYRNDEVRMVALWRDLHFEGKHRQVIVLVGESLDMRLRTQQEAWRQGLFRDGRMLILAVLLVWFSVQWALRPLKDLRREIRARNVDNLLPLDAAVEVEKDGTSVCGTSIMGLMMLGAAMGDSITISASGIGAELAIEQLVELVEARFHEEA